MTATAVSEAGGGSFCVGITRKASIAGRAARRLRARGALRRNRAKRSQSRDVRRIGHVRAKGLQQLKPGKTCFGTLSACCCQKTRECVFAAASKLASDAFSATSATFSPKAMSAGREQRPETSIRPHLRTHSRVFWQPPRKNPSKPLTTQCSRPQRKEKTI